jgi:hypothetical protein
MAQNQAYTIYLLFCPREKLKIPKKRVLSFAIFGIYSGTGSGKHSLFPVFHFAFFDTPLEVAKEKYKIRFFRAKISRDSKVQCNEYTLLVPTLYLYRAGEIGRKKPVYRQ